MGNKVEMLSLPLKISFYHLYIADNTACLSDLKISFYLIVGQTRLYRSNYTQNRDQKFYFSLLMNWSNVDLYNFNNMLLIMMP